MKVLFRLFSLLVLIAVVVVATLNIQIRHERKALQARAREFLSRPVPSMFQTNFIGSFGTGWGTVLSDSRSLIEQCANSGLIPDTSANAARVNMAHFEIFFCEEAAKTNAEAFTYIEDCKAIIEEALRKRGQHFEPLTNSVSIRVNLCPSVVKKLI